MIWLNVVSRLMKDYFREVSDCWVCNSRVAFVAAGVSDMVQCLDSVLVSTRIFGAELQTTSHSEKKFNLVLRIKRQLLNLVWKLYTFSLDAELCCKVSQKRPWFLHLRSSQKGTLVAGMMEPEHLFFAWNTNSLGDFTYVWGLLILEIRSNMLAHPKFGQVPQARENLCLGYFRFPTSFRDPKIAISWNEFQQLK